MPSSSRGTFLMNLAAPTAGEDLALGSCAHWNRPRKLCSSSSSAAARHQTLFPIPSWNTYTTPRSFSQVVIHRVWRWVTKIILQAKKKQRCKNAHLLSLCLGKNSSTQRPNIINMHSALWLYTSDCAWEKFTGEDWSLLRTVLWSVWSFNSHSHTPICPKVKKIDSPMHCHQGKLLWCALYGLDNNRALESLSSSFSFKSLSVLTYFTKKVNSFPFRNCTVVLSFSGEPGSINRIVMLPLE